MSPTNRKTVAEQAEARVQAQNKPPPPHSTVSLRHFKPPAALGLLALAVLFVILHSWQAQGQIQDNSLASMGNHIWQPSLEQQQQQRPANSDSQPTWFEQSVNQNAIGTGMQQQAYPILEQQFETTTSVKRNELAKLERRIDRLEFELRKSLHQVQKQHHDNSLSSITRAPNDIASGQSSGPANDEWRQNNQQQQQPTTTTTAATAPTMSMIDLGERLNLVEKFITITTTKMYELERKIKQLDKCECRIGCKWSVPGATEEALEPDALSGQQRPSRQSNSREPTMGQPSEARFYHDDENFMNSASNDARSHLNANGSSSSSTSSAANATTLVKRDGQVWHDKCNICSCHRGHVSCKRASCPRLDCDDPQQVPGRCCPVCYKPCTFRQQTVRHGNKLVINSNEQTCKECSCFDGRFQCQSINMVVAPPPPPTTTTTTTTRTRTRTRNAASASSSRLQREARADENLHLSDSESSDGNEADYNWQQDADADNNVGAQKESNYDTDDLAAESDKLIARDNYGEDADAETDEAHGGGDNLLGVDENIIAADGRGDEIGGRRLTRSRPARSAPKSGDAVGPLFCPPADCAESEQIRLENDCCTYCANFDFCARPWRHLPQADAKSSQSFASRHNYYQHTPAAAAAAATASRCHPHAICTNTLQRAPRAVTLAMGGLATNESSGQSATGSSGSPLKLRSIDSMFSCECRSGFKGDGLSSCEDIDECADDRLHDCDLTTTNCVNLAGSYECQCKRGFRPAAGANIEGAGDQSEARLMSVSVPAGERRLLQRCRDVDECQDGKLNRCHPQARCINSPGAYRCQCKRGYLGNGFECHKWFTSGPDVAAYLYRHDSSQEDYDDDDDDDDAEVDDGGDKAGAGNSTQAQQDRQTRPSRPPQLKSTRGSGPLTRVSKRVNLPLNTLDEDDDQDDDRTDMIAYLDDSSAAQDQFEPEDSGAQVPKLSESRWESLKYSAESFNQQAYTNSQAKNRAKSAAANPPDGSDQRRQAGPASSSINTRTMFLQPPPRMPRPKPWWDEPETTTTRTITTPASSGPTAGNVTNRIASTEPASPGVGNNGSSTLASGDSGASKSSLGTQQQQQQQQEQQQEQSSKSIQTTAQQQSASIPVTGSNVLSANKKLPIGYKRGTIIASASSSPRKGTPAAASSGGSGIVANERAYSSSQQQPFRSQQMPPSSSGSASSNIIAPSHHFNIIMTTAVTTTTTTWLASQAINIWTNILAYSISNLVRGTYLSLAIIALSSMALCTQCNHIFTI